MHILGISGSKRPGNYTLKALSIAMAGINQSGHATTDTLDPVSMKLLFPGEAGDDSDIKKMQLQFKKADGFILATPEYHGSFSSVIKVIIENMGFPSALSQKPVALLGVAQGRIGAIKSLESLRGVCSHVGALVLPGAISISGIQNVFDENGQCTDEGTQKSITKCGSNLIDYLLKYTCPDNSLESSVRKLN